MSNLQCVLCGGLTKRGVHHGEITGLYCIQNDEKLLSTSHDGLVKCFKLCLDIMDPIDPIDPIDPMDPMDPIDSLGSFRALEHESVQLTDIEDLLANYGSFFTTDEASRLTSSDSLVWSVDIGKNNGIAKIDINFNIARIAVSFDSPMVCVFHLGQLDWDTWHSSPLITFSGHADVVTCLAFDRFCCLLSGSRDQHVLTHEMNTFSQTECINVNSAINALCCVNEWSFIASSDYRILACSPEQQSYLVGHVGQVTSLAFVRTECLVVSGSFDVTVGVVFVVGNGDVALSSFFDKR